MIRDSMAREHGGNVAVPSTRFTKREHGANVSLSDHAQWMYPETVNPASPGKTTMQRAFTIQECWQQRS